MSTVGLPIEFGSPEYRAWERAQIHRRHSALISNYTARVLCNHEPRCTDPDFPVWFECTWRRSRR